MLFEYNDEYIKKRYNEKVQKLFSKFILLLNEDAFTVIKEFLSEILNTHKSSFAKCAFIVIDGCIASGKTFVINKHLCENNIISEPVEIWQNIIVKNENSLETLDAFSLFYDVLREDGKFYFLN